MHTVGGEIDRNVVRIHETRWKGSAPLLGVGVTSGLGLPQTGLVTPSPSPPKQNKTKTARSKRGGKGQGS
jgi:hypothetical protein